MLNKYLSTFAAACLGLLSPYAMGGVSGEVVFVKGAVAVGKLPEGKVAAGTPVAEGDALVTGQDGYLHVKMIDGGLLVLRPNSRAQVLDYVVNTENPAASRMRIQVLGGVVRSVTGAGGKAARGQFRVNTPIAALGVRGTDFTIFADPGVTRAAVTSGGIVMTPLGGSCREQDVGPCEGPSAAELFAGNPQLVVQFAVGNPKPVIVDARQSGVHPDSVAPPSPQESSVSQTPKATTVVNQVSVESRVVDTIVRSEAPVVTPPVAEPQRVVWGRWSTLLDPESTSTVRDGRAQVAANAKFGLFRDKAAPMTMPTEGTVAFRLANQESFFHEMGSNQMTPAVIENAKFSADFGAGTFATSFDMHGGNLSTQVSAKGGFFPDGRFVSSVISSNASVSGALAGTNATQAGYVFHQSINSSVTAYGATYWTR